MTAPAEAERESVVISCLSSQYLYDTYLTWALTRSLIQSVQAADASEVTLSFAHSISGPMSIIHSEVVVCRLEVIMEDWTGTSVLSRNTNYKVDPLRVDSSGKFLSERNERSCWRLEAGGDFVPLDFSLERWIARVSIVLVLSGDRTRIRHSHSESKIKYEKCDRFLFWEPLSKLEYG